MLGRLSVRKITSTFAWCENSMSAFGHSSACRLKLMSDAAAQALEAQISAATTSSVQREVHTGARQPLASIHPSICMPLSMIPADVHSLPLRIRRGERCIEASRKALLASHRGSGIWISQALRGGLDRK